MKYEEFEAALKRRKRTDLLHPEERCPDSETLAAYAAGDLDAKTARNVRVHLAFCDECFQDLRLMETPAKADLKALRLPAAHAKRGRPAATAREWLAIPGTVLIPARTPRFALAGEGLRGKRTKQNRVTLQSDCRFLTLRFFVPIRVAPGVAYAGRIDDSTGTVVRLDEMASADAKGNFELICPRFLFAPGEYALVVEERERGRKKAAQTFRFPFVVTA